MAKTNYQFEKRQRDLAAKKKQEEKRQKKLEKSQVPPTADAELPVDVEAESEIGT